MEYDEKTSDGYYIKFVEGGFNCWDDNGNSSFIPYEDDSPTFVSDSYGARWE